MLNIHSNAYCNCVYCFIAVFNALADSRKNVVCEECSGMSANQKSTESDKDRDSDDYDNDYDNFAPPPQTVNNQQNNIQQQGSFNSRHDR